MISNPINSNSNNNIFDIIVIGSGPAGLMAAGTAAEASKKNIKIAVLEKMHKTSLKLGITGKGRCNLTNNCTIPEFLEHTSKNGKFLRQAFSKFYTLDTIQFFNDKGVETGTERGRRVFPLSGKAKDIVVAMNNWVKSKSNIQVYIRKSVDEILKIDPSSKNNDTNFKIIVNKDELYFAKKVIIATGGMSYPLTGSTGDGYSIVEKLGHKIEKLYPILVPLIASPILNSINELNFTETQILDIMKDLDRLNLRNVSVDVWIDGKKKDSRFGELVFTENGLTGPIILRLSRAFILDITNNDKKVVFSLDFKPALDSKKLDLRLIRELEANNKKNFVTVINNLLPRKLENIISILSNIPLDKKCHSINSKDRKRFLRILKYFEFEITGFSSFKEAIVTKGGINTSDIFPKTMESKIIKNLYFAGEIIDLDADTGGYNLQIAFSTGYSAGLSAGLNDENS